MNKVDNVHAFLMERAAKIAEKVKSVGLDLPDASYFRNCVRSLDGVTLAYDADSLDQPVIDEKKMTATFKISTYGKDRMGDRVLPRGCLPTLDNYRRNPRVFFSHRSTDLPLGSARDPDSKELLLSVFDDHLLSTCVFHGKTAESNIIFDLVASGELQTASIGFLPIIAAILDVEKQKERPETNEFGEDLVYFGDGSNWFPSLRFHQWDLTEWSIVPIPANAECISQHLSRGHVHGEVITPLLRKSLEPFSLPQKVWSPGAVMEVEEKIKEVEVPEVVEREQVKKEVIYDVETSSFKWKDSSDIILTLDELYTLIDVGRENKIFNTLFSPEDQKFLMDGGVIHAKDNYLVKSLLDDLIPPPVQKEEEQQVVSPPVIEDKYKNWPLGAKLLSMFKDHMSDWVCMIDEHCELIDNPKVKKYSMKKKDRLGKESKKLDAFGYKLYPEKFPMPSPDQEESDNLVNGPVKNLESDIDWQSILEKLEVIEQKEEERQRKFYELTGR